MPLTRIELLLDGLDPQTREALLEVFWQELRISPGMVSADGNFELLLTGGGEPEEAPTLRLGAAEYPRLTPERLRQLLRQRRPERAGGLRR